MDIRLIDAEAEAARALMLNLNDVLTDSADDDALREDTIEGQTDLKELISEAIDMAEDMEDMSDVIAKRIEALKARKARMENKAEMIRAAVASALGAVNLRTMRLPAATLTLKATPPKVIISEESEIPSQFWKPQPPKLDKKALAEALKNGPVAGATLSNGGTTIQIKRS